LLRILFEYCFVFYCLFVFCSIRRRPLISSLFPYTTLFRSMQLPVLGTLFRSRDYVNNQTELMVLVTPFVVRAVAQKDLSRPDDRSEEHTSELQSREKLVCRLLLEKKKKVCDNVFVSVGHLL